ncbi:DUF2635 domain-containing protein [Microvirga zambiensis]|uniref:DUF2635 domain-containing protein n=1 Tax=Microvirga zambiensis TaxID=1402137 RepID=UPI00191E3A44|nr:DUF2635 domain-containing protein [Microvirga zambiensis]
MSDTERKFIKPARKGASIPDPDRGRDLPWEGIEVDWSPYWAGLLERSDITVKEVETEPVQAKPKAKRTAAPAQRAEPEKADDRPSVDAQPTSDPEPYSDTPES